MNAVLEMKASVFDLTEGKYELDSLDDELPLTILCFTKVNIANAFVELSIVEDFFKFSKDCIDKESKIITNFKGALEFISQLWNLDN